MATFLRSFQKREEEKAEAEARREGEECGNVRNWNNSPSRWSAAIDYFRENCSTLREGSTGNKCCVNAVLDVSGSMEGEKLTAVKLGICSLVANLNDKDEMNITAFSGKCKPVTHGFKPVLELRRNIPELLHQLQTDGCTACFDAIISGIKDLRDRSSIVNTSESPQKNIIIVLTDGEDNESRHRASHVLQHIVNPGINKFMFLMVAADMHRRQERAFQDWMNLVHCKQVSVSVRTGTKLVGVFKEVLLSRILQTALDNTRFLQEPGDGIEADLSNEALTQEGEVLFTSRFSRLARIVHDSNEEHNDDSDCDSEGISRCYSASAMDWEDECDSYSDDDMTSLRYSPTSPQYRRSMSDVSAESYTAHLQTMTEHDCVPGSHRFPAEFYCPITTMLMQDPVICADGHTYERTAIESWLRDQDTAPLTNLPLSHKNLTTNYAVKSLIEAAIQNEKSENNVVDEISSVVPSLAMVSKTSVL